jgi:hypothetical protein
MGGFASQVQEPQTSGQNNGGKAGGMASQMADQNSQPMVGADSGGKGAAPAPQPQYKQPPQPMGKGGVQSNSATSGQPRMGQQNQYSNTVGQWDNTQQQQPQFGGGKGKG